MAASHLAFLPALGELVGSFLNVVISWRYPLVELATALLFAGVAGRLGYNWAVPAYLVLFAGLRALSCIDLEHLLLPRAIVYRLLAMVAVLLLIPAVAYGAWHDYWVAWVFAGGWFAPAAPLRQTPAQPTR